MKYIVNAEYCEKQIVLRQLKSLSERLNSAITTTQTMKTKELSITPAPWIVSLADPNKVLSEDYGVIAWTPCDYKDPEMTEADARLISAAPDLLKACQMLMDAHGALIGTEYGNELVMKAIDKANSAILKAGA